MSSSNATSRFPERWYYDGVGTVCDGDFGSDACLDLTGDFAGPEEKKAFADEIVRRLNGMQSEDMSATPLTDDALLPCPFCGGEADHSIGRRGDGTPWPFVECVECGATTEPDVWNRRTQSETGAICETPEQLEAQLRSLQSEVKFRRATPAENLRILAARLSDRLSPAEKREIEEAAALLSAVAALSDIERRVVEMIRYIGVKAEVKGTAIGEMCHEARSILRNAHLDYETAFPSAIGTQCVKCSRRPGMDHPTCAADDCPLGLPKPNATDSGSEDK